MLAGVGTRVETKGGRAVIKRTQITIATIISIVSWWCWEMLCWFCFLLLGLQTLKRTPELRKGYFRSQFQDALYRWEGVRGRNLKQSVTCVHSREQREGAHACIFLLHSLCLFNRIVRPQLLGTLATYRLGCPTSVNMVKTISCKHAHRPVWPRRSLTEPLLPGDSRLYQVDH